jgi:hypothetical protein
VLTRLFERDSDFLQHGECLMPFAQQSENEVLNPDMPVSESFRFFGGKGQHALVFVAQRQVHRGVYLFGSVRL